MEDNKKKAVVKVKFYGGGYREKCSNPRYLTKGCTRLMYACQQGHTGTIIKELRTKPNAVRRRDRSRKSALHYCSEQPDLVAAASVAVAAPELLESADEDGFTPLHLAVIQGNMAMVNLLLANQADVNALDHEGHSVVHWATVCGEVEALRAVLIAGANVATPDINGGSPLHYAAQMCGANYDSKLNQSSSKLALEILGILLAHPKSSVDVADKDGRQPLLWAASAGSAKAVIALVKAGARVESSDKDGLTALHCAASRGHTECIDTLISLCGAPTDLIDSNGCTALHYAVTLGHADATSRLLDLEADPNRQDRKGRTPAHCGCAKGQFETVKLLKDRGANLWLRNAKGDLPVHEAAISGRRELVEWLLEQKPKQVNTTSNDGRSLLHIAAGGDNTDMCKMLLDFGADINCIYRNARAIVMTPLDCALQKGYRSTAKFLQSHGGLPVSKLHLSARRPNAFNDQELVKPLKYIEKEEVLDLRTSKKYVVYVKRSDSESSECSCVEKERKKDFQSIHTCKHRRKKLRRRTSSCSDTLKSKDDGSADILRSKSNIEIHRRKSRERVYSTEDEDENDSCENCCRHKRKFRHRRKSRKSKDYVTVNVLDVTDKSRIISDKYQISMESQDASAKDKDDKTPLHSEEVKGLDGQEENESKVPQDKIDEVEVEVKRLQKEATFIKSSTEDAKPPDVGPYDLTDEEEAPKSEKLVTQAEVHQVKQSSSDTVEEPPAVDEAVLDKVRQEVESVISDAQQAAEGIVESSAAEEVQADEEQPKEAEGQTEPVEPTEEETKTAEAAEVEEAPPSVEAGALGEQEPPKDDEQIPEKVEITEEEPAPENVESTNLQEETPEAVPEIQEDVPTLEQGVKIEDLNEDDDQPVPHDSTGQEEAVSLVEQEHAEKHQVEPSEKQQQGEPTETSEQSVPLEEPYAKQRQAEGRQSFMVIEDSAIEEIAPRKSSFTILKSDESIDIEEAEDRFSGDQERAYKVVDGDPHRKGSGIVYTSEEEEESIDEEDAGVSIPQKMHSPGKFSRQPIAVSPQHDYNGRKRRIKRRIKSSEKARIWRVEGPFNASRDQDSGFEPSPRASKTKIPSPRSVHTSILPRRPIYATLDSRSCSSRVEARKLGDKNACNMTAVTKSIQRNIRRYYMERKIFQHLLELKSLQIRSSKLNESVLVKRAVDDYHKSCLALGAEIGGSLRRYPYTEYTFKNFEMFLYETLKGLQKSGTNNFQNINEVYEEAERRLSPDYNAYEKALQCTTKTHRCLHAAHAYTGIPCAAYIPMMNHHTMPKLGFGPYKKTGVGSFYLPKILTSKSKTGNKVSLELSHGKSKQLISLPSDKLDSNKRYYVTFTVKGADVESKLQHDITPDNCERK